VRVRKKRGGGGKAMGDFVNKSFILDNWFHNIFTCLRMNGGRISRSFSSCLCIINYLVKKRDNIILNQSNSLIMNLVNRRYLW
jgi:hypothetical protein